VKPEKDSNEHLFRSFFFFFTDIVDDIIDDPALPEVKVDNIINDDDIINSSNPWPTSAPTNVVPTSPVDDLLDDTQDDIMKDIIDDIVDDIID